MAEPNDDVPRIPDYGSGVYRRRIRIELIEVRGQGGVVVGELEDDFHHFRAYVTHDGSKVTAIEGEGLRIPWTTCADAGDPLDALRGAPLLPSAADVARHADVRLQCTHLYDAAVLAVANAARGHARRVYDATIPDRNDGRAGVTLACNGTSVLEWQMDGMQITEPAPYAGQGLLAGFVRWCNATLDVETAEAAQVLRRALFIGLGRQYDFDRIPRAGDFAGVAGRCHTFNDGRIEQAGRVPGTVRNLRDVAPDTLADAPRTAGRGPS